MDALLVAELLLGGDQVGDFKAVRRALGERPRAILDADALGNAFAETRDPVDALLLYESRRLPATASVVAANRSKGPEAVLQLARERVKGPEDDVHALISQAEIDAITLKYQQVAGFDANTLRKRADARAEPGQRPGT